VVRYWANLEGRVSGSDVQRRAIDWCRANLRFARFETNGLAPPLAFADGSFDVAYALSVLTHLPEPLQFAWIDELARVTERDGHVIVTTHGERYLDQLDDDEHARFDRGELVVRRPEVAGTNLCATFHPPSWVREHLIPRGFEEVAFVAEGAKGNPNQDLFLLRRAA